jgi:very-short-patch-repair endonuclease
MNCLYCHKSLLENKSNKKYCSRSCCCKHIASKSDRTEKTKKTNLERYGVENPSQSNIIKEKKKETLLKNYGVSNPSHSEEINNKKKETLLKNYGVDHPMQSTQIKAKLKNTYLQKYGVENPTYKNFPKNVLDKLNNKNWLLEESNKKCFSQIAKELKISKSTVGVYAKKFNIAPQTFSSTTIEQDIENILIENNINYIKNDRTVLGGKEIDFYLPDFNLGIEVHGLYWHSNQFLNKNYHREKYELAKAAQIDLIQFTEEDVNYSLHIVDSIICSRCGIFKKNIFARKCTIQKVSSALSRQFYNENHLQQFVNTQNNYALLYGNEIVSMMSFGKPRFSKHQFEILRFANKLHYNIIGGAMRLFSAFINENAPESIVSYSDMQYFTGNLYTKLGFELVNITKPNYSYIANGRLHNRMKYQKKKILKEFPNTDITKTEKELVSEHYGYYRFYHVGQRVHIWNR